MATSNRNAEPRFKKRLPCKLRLGKQVYTGLVLNVSRTGLFIQTSALPEKGEAIAVTLNERAKTDDIEVAAEVIWQRKVPHQLRTVAEGGLGVEIRYAPESYYSILAAAAQGSQKTGGTTG